MTSDIYIHSALNSVGNFKKLNAAMSTLLSPQPFYLSLCIKEAQSTRLPILNSCYIIKKKSELKSDWRQTSALSDTLSHNHHVPHSSAHINGLLEKETSLFDFQQNLLWPQYHGFDVF
jgi:hypothetical protein